MPRVPKSPEGDTPKKRVSSPKTDSENGTNGTKVAKKTRAASKSQTAELVTTSDAPPVESIEERIRARAYELYLRRGGHGGSPEQDWFQAVAEVHGESAA